MLYKIPASHLVGRDDALHSLKSHLDDGLMISATETGLGLTSLARRLAADSQEDYPDGYIEVDLRGGPAATQEVSPQAVHWRILRTLIPQEELPEKPSALRRRYLQVLSQRKVLLFLDNAASAAQLRRLVPSKGSAVIVASEMDIAASIPKLHNFVLDPLTAESAYHLLIQLSPGAAKLSRRALDAVTTQVGGVPLAIRIVAPLLDTASSLSPKKLIQRLDAAQKRIVALRGVRDGRSPVDAALEVACEFLDYKLRPYFAALAVFPAPFTAQAAAAVWNVPGDAAKQLLERLAMAALVDHHVGSVFYESHDRIRLYAQELLIGQPERAQEIVSRYVGHYLLEAIQVSTHLTPSSPTGLDALSLRTLWDHVPTAWHRANGEDPGWPRPTEMDRWICDFPGYSKPLLSTILSRTEHRAWLAQAVDAAVTIGEIGAASANLTSLGRICTVLGDHEAALAACQRKVSIAREAGALDTAGEALMHQGALQRDLGQPQRAEESWQMALALFEQVGDERSARVRSLLDELEERIEGSPQL
jgi:tetratricopeptide (TPR) repeat protein